MLELLREERTALTWASLAVLLTSLLNLTAPVVLAYAIDHPLSSGDFPGVLRYGGILLGLAFVSLFTQYLQTLGMGGVGQRVVFRLREKLFHKIQELPMSFFQQHQTGDLISRLANDTEKLSQFFSQSLTRFVGSLVTMIGAAFFLLILNPKLGAAALVPALAMLASTWLLGSFVRVRNRESMEAFGKLSGQVAESLENFKVVVAFNRRDHYRAQFEKVNGENFGRAIRAGLVNGVVTPFYGFCAQLGQLVVLGYGLILVSRGEFTLGLLIGYFVYLNRFYDPLRQLAALWATFQAAMSGYDRISEILSISDRLPILPKQNPEPEASRLEFRGVDFAYIPERKVLEEVSFRLEVGGTYAFVGPTGGGKTTIASLMARLFDPSSGTVLLDGHDLRTVSAQERSQKIGFILQDPFLFGETLADNVTSLEGLDRLFDQGLQTPVAGLSLGQRQVVAFLRAVLRRPELLILDEATANIDTVTERALSELLESLPETTTLVVIAHRLSTIEKADGIFFVNSGRISRPTSVDQTLALLRSEKRVS